MEAQVRAHKVGRDSRGRVTGTPPADVHTLRETRGSSVLKMLKSLTKKKKSLVGCEATRFSSSGSAFLIPEVSPVRAQLPTCPLTAPSPVNLSPQLDTHPQQTA